MSDRDRQIAYYNLGECIRGTTPRGGPVRREVLEEERRILKIHYPALPRCPKETVARGGG